MHKQVVKMNKNGIYINDTPVIVLCSSLFYFRVPSGLWQDRLKKVKESGYNCIDVYFPWNYHELQKDNWDFSGNRDVESFLKMAAVEGLWVIARPGPYICSEWDGGALPSYLFTDRQMKVRDNDPAFLAHVSRWFEKIMPLLKKYEQGNEGSIIAVQLDNELDFYDCYDRTGYMTALKDMALSYDISVPLFACAGQGDIYGATGHADGVMPACNFYPDDKDAHIESLVTQYYEDLQAENYPLCVTETNRTHFLLRRLLSSGVKLLGPYNQVSGTDFGFTNSINNWGPPENPVAYLTSDYDFHGMVSPEGIKRQEYSEGILLGKLIQSLGESLAEAKPEILTELTIKTNMPLPQNGPYSLVLSGGGRIIFLPNLNDEKYDISFENDSGIFPKKTKLTIHPDRCHMVLHHVPLKNWGLQGEIIYSTAELGLVEQDGNKTVMVLHSEGEAEISLRIGDGFTVTTEGMAVKKDGENCLITFFPKDISKTNLTMENGSILTIIGLSRKQAPSIKGVTIEGGLVIKDDKKESTKNNGVIDANWSYIESNEEDWISDAKKISHPLSMEEVGLLRGYGWYRCNYPNDKGTPNAGILLHGASDIISLYRNGKYKGTCTPGGGFHYYQFDDNSEGALELMMRTEIWGHSNFDDPRLPALALNSLKGIENLTVVHQQQEIQAGWHYLAVDNEKDTVPIFDKANPNWKRIHYDRFLTGAQHKKGYYVKELFVDSAYTNCIIHFKGIQSVGKVFVDEQFVSNINPLNPYVDISNYIAPGKSVMLGIYLEQYYGESGEEISLLTGNKAENWSIQGLDEEGLLSIGREQSTKNNSVTLPLEMAPGSVGWLSASLERGIQLDHCWMAYIKGRNAKLTVFFNNELVGRLWLPSSARPKFTGGNQTRFYLPSSLWKEDNNQLLILTEAIELKEPGVIEKINFKKVND